MSKKKITVHLGDIEPAVINGPIKDICELLQKFKDQQESRGFTNIHLVHSEGHCYECEGPSEYYLRGDRDETTEERARRLAKAREDKNAEQKRSEKALALKRKLYEELKKEFDPPNKPIECTSGHPDSYYNNKSRKEFN